MKNMSFALTTEQFIHRIKTVTRRNGWKNLRPGDLVMAVEKCQGLKKGEKVKKLGLIEILSVAFERLDLIITNTTYGYVEVNKEGFPHLSPFEFIEMYCKHNKCTSDKIVTRIEYKYLDLENPNSSKLKFVIL